MEMRARFNFDDDLAQMEDRHGDAASCQRPLPLTRTQRRQLPWAGGIGVGRICLPVDSQAMIVYYMCQDWVRFSSLQVSGLMFAPLPETADATALERPAPSVLGGLHIDIDGLISSN